jgi:hypothetical protein
VIQHRPPLAAYALLLVCAAARLMLQMAALPPYAGLDEIYHVARLAFVRAEHRNPTTSEASMPRYLAPPEMPAMGEFGARWPAVVAEHRGRAIVDRPLTEADVTPYVRRNYEAQQTSCSR